MVIDDFLQELNAKQKEICLSKDNFLLTACPGSGKTRTITYRLAYIADEFKNSRKYNIAITYTNRAADEIENRLSKMSINLDNVWTGTIHQFCMSFIIRPYAMYSDRLKRGYRIIDEYTADAYGREIAEILGVKCSYYDNPLEIPKVKEVYEQQLIDRKEIDFEQILKLSQELLIENHFIAENVSKTIRSIHVDEFQDTQEEQYQILSAIIKADKSINVLFVGDVNQSIYGSLGGIAKTKEQIEVLLQIPFREECLSGCYRSTQRMIDYYTNFEVMQTGAFASNSVIKNERGVISYNSVVSKECLLDSICKIVGQEIERGVVEEEICVVAPQWALLFDMAKKLKANMPNVQFDAPEISPFKYDPLNPFYLMAKLIYTATGRNIHIRKKLASEILTILFDEYQVYMDQLVDKYDLLKIINGFQSQNIEGLDYYEECIRYTFQCLNIDLEYEPSLKETFTSFVKKAKERIKRYSISNTNAGIAACFCEKKGIVLSTIHGVKGEEYTTVISFALLNGYLPHWDYIWNDEKKRIRTIETKKLLYVLCSRAKKNLYLFSESERTTQKGYSYCPTDELVTVSFEYDKTIMHVC